MRKTTNYGLRLYDLDDNYDITAEENSLNNNMELIDNALKEKANNNEIPTKVSELTNDSNYIDVEVVKQITGELESLITEEKTNLVSAINEVMNSIEECKVYTLKSEAISFAGGFVLEQENKDKLSEIINKNLDENVIVNLVRNNGCIIQLNFKVDTPTQDNSNLYVNTYPIVFDPQVGYGYYVQSINYKAENGVITVTDFTRGAYNTISYFAKISDITKRIPTNVSAFTNDKGYLTSVPSEYITETELNNKGYLTEITEEDKTEIVQMVIESLGGNPVFGYVDENNNIIVSGNLPDGDYTVMYEMEEGDTINIGNLVLDNTVNYSIINNLTNCTNSNNAATIVESGSYSATITANSGYELKSLSVTMGDSPVSVSGGNINIASVTGNIVITAVAEEIQNEPENVLETVGYKSNTRIRSSSGEEQTLEGVEATNYIPITYGQTISLQNIKVENSGNNSVAVYNSNKQYISGVYLCNFISGVKINGAVINGELVSQKLDSSKFIHDSIPISASSGIAFIRFSANEITENSIVKVQN